MRKLVVLLPLALAACAGKTSWESAARELYVETLPRGAQVLRDGQPSGMSPVSVPIPARLGEESAAAATVVKIRAEKEGYLASTKMVDSGALPPKILIVLSPVFGSGETPPEPPGETDAEGLYRAGAALQRNGRCEDAVEFLDKVIVLAPKVGKPYRELGSCMFKLGDKQRAADLWAKYLLIEPEAPDAAVLQAKIDKIRGIRTLDESQTGGGDF